MLQAGGACYSWRLPLLDGLVVVSIEARKKLVRCSRELTVRGVLLAPREPQRATLVERDMKGDKCSSRVKVLELVVSTPCGRV